MTYIAQSLRTWSALALSILLITLGTLIWDRATPPHTRSHTPSAELSEYEKNDILFMREEEKLARDVYTALYAASGIQAFKNITESEQRHFEAMGRLIDTYSLADSSTPDVPGTFTNPELGALYTQLVTEGSVSQTTALTVGATIEDLDLRDLAHALTRTQRDDIRATYDNLARGSRNHLRTFVNLLEASGTSYTAQYITAAEVEQILATPRERGRI